MQHVLVDDPLRHALQKLGVRNRVKVLGQIGVNYIRIAFTKQLMHFLDCVLRAPLRPVPIGIGFEIRLAGGRVETTLDRLDQQFCGGLHYPVPNSRNSERPLAASGLRDHHPPHRLWLVRLVA